MKKYIYSIFAFALLLGGCAADEQLATVEPAPDKQPTVVAGELMVKFAPYVVDIIEEHRLTRSGDGALTRSGVLPVDEVLDILGGCELKRVFPVDPRTEERTRAAGLHQWYVVGYSADVAAEQAAARFAALGEVQNTNLKREIKRAYNTERRAVPVSADELAKLCTTRTAADYPHNDLLLPYQWHLVNRGDLFPGVAGTPVGDTPSKGVAGADVNCEDAWSRTTGDPSIVVAILDEGIFAEHPDLKESMWHNEGEIFRSMKDNDGNGYIGDYYGYNFVKDTGIISWDDIADTGHASHVAGVIAAQNDNGIGIGSVAGGTQERPGVRLMSCQIFSGDLMSNSYNSIRAIKYAADNGATVLQCSWGYASGMANIYDWGSQGFTSEEMWEEYCPLEKEVLDYFVHNAGSPNGPVEGGIAIFASGNESAPMAGFPGAAEMCVSVAATAADFTPATFTNYAEFTRISAPGGDQNYYWEYYGMPTMPQTNINRGTLGCILSTLPYHISESGYGYMEGTSMACPHVSGVVALGLSYAAELRRHFTAEQIRELLYSTATSIDDYCTGKKNYYRYVPDVGLNQAMQMNLGDYRAKMGSGQVNAGAFLAAIADEANGSAMCFPNVYVALDGEVTVAPAVYFLNGESLAYSVSIDDTQIASASVSGGKIVFKGLKEGTTAATITAGGKSQGFAITVRKNAGNGWL